MKVIVLRIDAGDDILCPLCNAPLNSNCLQFRGGVGVCTDCAYWIELNGKRPPTALFDKARHPEDWRRWKGLSLWCPKPEYRRPVDRYDQGQHDPGSPTIFCINCGKSAIPPGTPDQLCEHCRLT